MISRRCRLVVTAALICGWGWSSPAQARASKSDGDRVKKAKARDSFKVGRKHYRKRRYDQAIKAWNQAYRLWPYPHILLSLATIYAVKNDPINAVKLLRQYRKQAQSPMKALPPVLRRMQRQVGVLIVRAPISLVAIYVGGRLVGQRLVELVLRPGDKIVEVRLGDRVMASKQLHVIAGKELRWEVKLGRLVVQVPHSRVEIYVEGKLRGRRKVDLVLGCGPKTVEVRLGNRVIATKVVTIRAGKRSVWEPNATLLLKRRRGSHPRRRDRRPKRRDRRPNWGYFATTAGVTVALCAAAVATSIKAKQLHDEYMENRWDVALRDSGMKYELTTNILWGLTAAGAVTAVMLGFFTRWRARERSLAITPSPMIVPGGLGISILWRR